MRILGIDPGLRLTGFGVIDVQGRALSYVASGVIRIPPGSLPPRLKSIHEGVSEVSAGYRPEIAVAAIVCVHVNPQSTLLLGQAWRGDHAGRARFGGDEHTALQVKQAVVGYGRAAVAGQAMAQHLLRLPGVFSTDAADALACRSATRTRR